MGLKISLKIRIIDHIKVDCFLYICCSLNRYMKNASNFSRLLVISAFAAFIFCGCATHHKKDKCNTCPKWSKVENQTKKTKI